MAEIACKMGHQRVGYGDFFSTKLSGNHIDTY